MSYRRRHRWFRRMVLGLAFATAIFAGRVSPAAAQFDPGPGELQDPYLTDVFVRQGEAQGGPDGGPAAGAWTVVPYLSHGILTEADAQAAAAEAIRDRTVASGGSSVPSGDEIAIKNAIAERELAAAERVQDLSLQLRGEALESVRTQETFIPGVTDFPRVQVASPAVRPDDVADRFAHSDVAPRSELADSGWTFDENDALTVGIGALVLALGLGLALGVLRRPRLAGF
jgi:hypothetical protein